MWGAQSSREWEQGRFFSFEGELLLTKETEKCLVTFR